MGLTVTHDCWSGPYTSFSWWREEVAKAAGYPPLQMMEGFFDPNEVYERLTLSEAKRIVEASSQAPLSWAPYESDPLTTLLAHSDCDGGIAAADCAAIADRLEEAKAKMVGDRLIARTERFIAGLRAASAAGEGVEFR
jgi:hypothetical protein